MFLLDKRKIFIYLFIYLLMDTLNIFINGYINNVNILIGINLISGYYYFLADDRINVGNMS